MGHRNWLCEKRFIEDNIYTLKNGGVAYFCGCKYEMRDGGQVYKERRDRTSSRLIAVVKNGIVSKVE